MTNGLWPLDYQNKSNLLDISDDFNLNPKCWSNWGLYYLLGPVSIAVKARRGRLDLFW